MSPWKLVKPATYYTYTVCGGVLLKEFFSLGVHLSPGSGPLAHPTETVPPAGGATQGNTTASRKLLKKAKATRQQQQDATSGIDEAGNQWWWAGHWHLYSPGGTFQAKFQSDGNLVIYDEKSGKAVWRAGTEARPDKKKKQGVKMIFYTPVRHRRFRLLGFTAVSYACVVFSPTSLPKRLACRSD